ncbi:MAG: hypothetical protein COX80_03100 [Candidatus Magasanikbacteria bacterium CG_4_10_14_0_2_um_filter_33_14]|uniref:Uncharacterized protein n=1 Tax=Candidatus Magasanikbacteria bacterium CG_4_10_14_0_2_um_filter_33_14 TaxID=1974636 RepID=A0A2M7VA92_9BACT|nr:MAG: hypothetical protein COX80_03100 [Candidatus Magasanikbacteria bacterium CG_4_10_14_0_2_um_filter_33_14]
MKKFFLEILIEMYDNGIINENNEEEFFVEILKNNSADDVERLKFFAKEVSVFSSQYKHIFNMFNRDLSIMYQQDPASLKEVFSFFKKISNSLNQLQTNDVKTLLMDVKGNMGMFDLVGNILANLDFKIDTSALLDTVSKNPDSGEKLLDFFSNHREDFDKNYNKEISNLIIKNGDKIALMDAEKQNEFVDSLNEVQRIYNNSKHVHLAPALMSKLFENVGDIENLVSVANELSNSKLPFIGKGISKFVFEGERNITEIVEAVNEVVDIIEDNNLSIVTAHEIYKTVENMLVLNRKEKEQYIEILGLIDSSPSQEIKHISFELVAEVIKADNPLKAYRTIESIFVKNNLPLVGKLYRVFETLYPQKRLDDNLKLEVTSPYLRSIEGPKRFRTIFRDLLKVHIDSDNRSLRLFLESLQEGETMLAQVEGDGKHEPTKRELKKLEHFITKLNTLFLSSQLHSIESGVELNSDLTIDQIKDSYKNLKSSLDQISVSLGMESGNTVSENMITLFCGQLGYKSIEDVLTRMKTSKAIAHQRSMDMVSAAPDGYLKINRGDLLKGTDGSSMGVILESGPIARECIGAGATSDFTPHDIDFQLMDSSIEGIQDFETIVRTSISTGYGDVLMVVKDRGQYNITRNTDSEMVNDYDRGKYELYLSPILGKEHYGIRTGLSATEIDFLILEQEFDQRNHETLFLDIVENGYYIPVTDQTGKIIFTPEMYEEYRRFYRGVELYSGDDMEIVEMSQDMAHSAEIEKLSEEMKNERGDILEMFEGIRGIISEVLVESEIPLKDDLDMSIVGAELSSSGSTGRGTNKLGDFDFDLILRLDSSDASKVKEVIGLLCNRFGVNKSSDEVVTLAGTDTTDLGQLRILKANIGGKEIGIDIAFVGKSGDVLYASHDAVRDRLSWIKENVGEKAHDDVKANIVLTKKVLTEGGAYKKVEHGSIGGIGVENWILSNGGNMLEAFRTFKEAAYDENNNRLPLSEFQKKYRILDPGTNVKYNNHSDFAQTLKEGGYERILDVIDKYIPT